MSRNPFLNKADFNREAAWPSPSYYKIKPLIGGDSNPAAIYHQAPIISIGTKLATPNAPNTNLASTRLPANNNKQRLAKESEAAAAGQKITDHAEVESMMSISNHTYRMPHPQHHNTPMMAMMASGGATSNELNVMQSVNYVSYQAPVVSLKFRDKGTELWKKAEMTPGPGAYDHHKFKTVARSRPKYSVSHAKLELNS